MTTVLKPGKFQCRVSSVLNRDVKLYGKHNLFDGCEETCWNTDQGSPQWIVLELESEAIVTSLLLQFQGGFTGKECHLEAGKDRCDLQLVQHFYPEDSNSLQTFSLHEPLCTRCLRIVFNSSTDLFGRIVVYKLELRGLSCT